MVSWVVGGEVIMLVNEVGLVVVVVVFCLSEVSFGRVVWTFKDCFLIIG